MQITKELIERYHQGRCNPEEQDAVEQWLESEDFEMSYPEDTDLTVLQDKGWKKLSNRYDIAVSAGRVRGVFKWNHYRSVLRFAACFLLLVGIAATYYLKTKAPDSASSILVYKTITTLKGQKLQVKLPDGTLVWLNSESVLRFPESFKGQQRELEFSGEGYFDVAKDSSKPFIIHTEKTKVQVLGTRFNLRALAIEKATSVVVEEGKVRFVGKYDQQETILTANNRGVFEHAASSASIMTSGEVHAEKYVAWKNNELHLDNLTIGEIAQTLERWYNVKINISNASLSKERYTGNFHNPTLKQVLESMSFAVKFNYRQEAQTLTFY